jgi:DNA-binding transcriptional LysR family regulator
VWSSTTLPKSDRQRLVVAAMQMEWVRRGHGLGLMPLRLAARAFPENVQLLPVGDLDLSMQVVAMRSPHLNRPSKVAAAIAEGVGRAIDTGP